MKKNNDISWMYDPKSVGIETQENAGSLLSDKGLDEMQRAESHSITFRLFSVSTWLFIALSLAMLAVATYGDNVNHELAVSALVLEGIALILYVIYAALTSSKGIMRSKFASQVGKKGYFIFYLVLGIFYVFVIDLSTVYFSIFIGLCYAAVCAVSLFAMRNNKVLERMSAENEDDNE